MSYLQRINKLRAALTIIEARAPHEQPPAAVFAASALSADEREAEAVPVGFRATVLKIADSFEAYPGSTARTIRGDDDIETFARQVAELTQERIAARQLAPSASTIYVQGYGADGKQVYTCIRSSSDVQEDTGIMAAALELVHARRRGVAISDARMLELIEGTAPMPDDFPEGEVVDAAISDQAHAAAVEMATLLALLGAETVQQARDTVNGLLRMKAIVNAPEIADFAAGVLLEAAHQRNRFGTSTDPGKAAEDWFWLVGYLAGKVLRALAAKDTDKAMHHCISTAAVMANWHAAIAGHDNSVRPGIDPVARGVEVAGEPA